VPSQTSLSQAPLQAVAQQTLPLPPARATHAPLLHAVDVVQPCPSAIAAQVPFAVQTGWFAGQAVALQQWPIVPATPVVQTSTQLGTGVDHVPSDWHVRVAAPPAGESTKFGSHLYVATEPTVVVGAAIVPLVGTAGTGKWQSLGVQTGTSALHLPSD
jgi:hypothetical protein